MLRPKLEAEQSGAGRGEPRWLPWIAFFSLALYALFCVGPWSHGSWRPEWDSALYLETARSLARGEGHSYLGEPFYLRPPGLSWLLSLLMGTGDSLPIAAANRLLMACAAGSVIALFFLLRRRFGTLLALSVALLTGTSPLFVKQFNYVLSEFPFLLLSFLGMCFAASWGKQPVGSMRQAMTQAALFIGAFYVRSQALLLLPGVFLLEAKRRGLQRALLPCLLFAAAALPWVLYSSDLAAKAPSPSRQFLLHDYGTALLRVDPSDPDSEFVGPAGWVERIQKNGAGLVNSALLSLHLGAPLSPDSKPGTRWPWWRVLAGGLFVLGFLLSFVLLLRTGWTLFEWFALTNAALILIYFTYAPRLAMPLLPALYLYVLALPLALTRLRWRWAGQLCANLIALALLAANLTSLAENQREPGRIKTLRADINAMANWARENTPEDAILLCKQGPMLGLKSDRRCYSSRYEGSLATLEKYAIDYVIFFGGQGTILEQEAVRRGGQQWEIEGSKRIVAYHLPPED